MWWLKIRYDFWAHAVRIGWGNHVAWNYYRFRMLPDQYREDMNDVIGLYCMGGEI